MRIMITGGLGGLGRHVSEELLETGHEVLIFDKKSSQMKKVAQKFPAKCIIWGDITNPSTYPDLSELDAVIHLAFIIPPKSEEPWARNVNIGGTLHLIDELEKVNPTCRFVFASSVTVVGVTQHLSPPITRDLPVNPTDNYTADKAECEELIQHSTLDWIILRFAESPHLEIDLSPSYLKQMYNIAWYNRVEFVHPKDIAIACRNAVMTEWSKEIYLIGGGPACQSTFYDQISQIFALFNLPPPKKEKFKQSPVWLDWYDTRRSQEILQFQHRTFDDYLKDLRKTLGWKLNFIKFFAPLAKYFI
ncbi:MAG: NAD-dependent epimerase/dehydratase family protein [Candidatus Helarchaeota archaeon]